MYICSLIWATIQCIHTNTTMYHRNERNRHSLSRRHCFLPVFPESGTCSLSVPCPHSLSNGGGGRQCDTNVPVMAESSTDTFSLHFDQSCINHCLLKNEGSLVHTESCTNLWVYALKKQFDSMSF